MLFVDPSPPWCTSTHLYSLETRLTFDLCTHVAMQEEIKCSEILIFELREVSPERSCECEVDFDHALFIVEDLVDESQLRFCRRVSFHDRCRDAAIVHEPLP